MISKNQLVIIFLILIAAISITSFVLISSKSKLITKQQNEISNNESEIKELESKIGKLEEENKDLDERLQQAIVLSQRHRLSYSNFIGSNTYYGSNGATVVFTKTGCDYFILENNSGYIVAEWYGGNNPSEGEVLYGDFNSFGMKDFTTLSNFSSHLWIDDYMLSKSSALEKINDKCD